MQNLVNLDTCDREPIHIPGAIQPHGYLLVLAEPSLDVLQVSANVPAFLDNSLEGLIGQPIGRWLDDTSFSQLQEATKFPELRHVNPLRMRVKAQAQETIEFDAIVHRTRDGLILEWEPQVETSGVSFFSFYHAVRQATLAIQNSVSFDEAFHSASDQVKKITDFDRVLVYRFDADWNGITVAEVREEFMDSYLGLRFPSTDIPAQARELYAKNWLRLIADVDYVPSPILSLPPSVKSPLDLSLSTLRSVSPVHLEYMRNMGTGSSMSISIMKDDRLWGLISCHHKQAKYVNYQTRVACEFIGQLLSQQISVLEGKEDQAARHHLREIQLSLTDAIRTYGISAAFQTRAEDFMRLMQASGVAVVLGEEVHAHGATPTTEAIRELVKWLKATEKGEVFVTDRLLHHYPHADLSRSAGLTALPLSRTGDRYFLWFRPEVIQTILWAGNPEKAVQENHGDAIRLHPRKSFAAWQETMRGSSLSWTRPEADAAWDLRNSVLADELARANAELEHSNAELDSFAHIAAHDLKEPLRGIRNYASFVLEDSGPNLDDRSSERLKAIQGMCNGMDGLLQGLYQFSRVGRIHLAKASTNLDLLVDGILLRLGALLEEKHVQVLRPIALPTVTCDPVRIGEVFYNLIINAIKYNDKPMKLVEIGWMSAAGLPMFYVKDNGIGIAAEHLDSVFTIFKRLHANSFGQGSGSGLAIVKRIVTRHGGRIWVDSRPGEGSTFQFTFGSDYKPDKHL